jgi:hypothetical protein
MTPETPLAPGDGEPIRSPTYDPFIGRWCQIAPKKPCQRADNLTKGATENDAQYSEQSLTCDPKLLRSRLLRLNLESLLPQPPSPVTRVGLDLGEKTTSNGLRETLAMLPGANSVDIHAEKTREHCLARPEQYPDALDVARLAALDCRRDLVGSDRHPPALQAIGLQDLGHLFDRHQDSRSRAGPTATWQSTYAGIWRSSSTTPSTPRPSTPNA